MMPFLSQITAFVLISVKENLRNRTYLVLILSGAAVFMMASMIGNMAVGDPKRVILNSGFWILGVYGLITSLVLGINLVHKDLRKKSVYTMLSRPLDRWTFIAGKFAGMISMGLIVHATLSLLMAGMLLLSGVTLSLTSLIAMGFIFLEWMVLSGFSIFFASFTSPLLHALFLSAMYFIGHWASFFYAFAQNSDDTILKKILLMLYYGFPNLEVLNYRTLALYNEAVNITDLIQSFFTASGWTFTAVLLAVIIFKHRKVI